MQGLGRHSYEFVLERMDQELSACNDMLAESGAYLTGSTPSPADCFLFAIVELVRSVPPLAVAKCLIASYRPVWLYFAPGARTLRQSLWAE